MVTMIGESGGLEAVITMGYGINIPAWLRLAVEMTSAPSVVCLKLTVRATSSQLYHGRGSGLL